MSDQDFTTAMLGALIREAGALAGRGIGQLSSQAQAMAPQMEQFVLINCKPLAARLYLVYDGAPHEYYHETGDQLSDGFSDLVARFITTGMNELSVEERQQVSKRVEQEGLALGILIESDSATVRGLAMLRGGGLPGSEELFKLVWPA